ncbi:MAG: hypothetical protein H5T50_08580 [Nitrososphaeria archaeon]|nr:hypothetical protein [Nitrososphaeria archaeon]
MDLKSFILKPYNLIVLFTSILFILLPILNISPQSVIFVGIVNLIALLINLKFKRFEIFAKIFVPIFNIIFFASQIYSIIQFYNIGLNLNVIVTIISSVILLILNFIIIFYGS